MTTHVDNNLWAFLKSSNRLALSASSMTSEYWKAYIHASERLISNALVHTQANIIDPCSPFRYWIKTTDLEWMNLLLVSTAPGGPGCKRCFRT